MKKWVLFLGILTLYFPAWAQYSAVTPGSLDINYQLGQATNSDITSILVLPDKSAFITGTFAQFDGQQRYRLAKLKPDGSLDQDFVPPVINAEVRGVTVQADGKLMIYGLFATVDGVSYNRLARLHVDGTLDQTFSIGTGFNSAVFKVEALSDGSYLVMGQFSTYQGASVGRFIKINSDGSLDASFAPVLNQPPTDFTVLPNGKIVISGAFTTVNSTTRNRLARLNPDGSLDTSFNPGTGPNNSVSRIARLTDGSLLINGFFSTYAGTSRVYLAKIDSLGTLNTNFAAGTINGQVDVVSELNDGSIMIGGAFRSVGGHSTDYLAKLNSDGTPDTGFKITSSNYFTAIFPFDDNRVLAGGKAYSVTQTQSIGLYWSNAAQVLSPITLSSPADSSFFRTEDIALTWEANEHAVSYNLQIAKDSLFTQFVVDEQVVGNESTPMFEKTLFQDYFWRVKGIEENGNAGLFSRFKRFIYSPANQGYIDVAWNYGGDGMQFIPTFAFEVDSNQYIVSSANTGNYNGVPTTTTIVLDSTGKLSKSLPILNGRFNSMVRLEDGKFLAGGGFSSFDNVANTRALVRLNEDLTLDDSFTSPITSGNVNAIVIQSDGKIVIGGTFTSVAGNTSNRIARLNADGSFDESFVTGVGFSGNVNVLAIQADEKIVASGTFSSYNGRTQNMIVRILPDGSPDAGFSTNISNSNTIYSIALQKDGKILVGGYNYLSRLNPDGSLDNTFMIGSGLGGGTYRTVESMIVQPDGKITVAGRFLTFNGETVGNIMQLLPSGGRDTNFEATLGFSDVVYRIIPIHKSRILAVGAFQAYNGKTQGRISRLFGNPNASLLPSPFLSEPGLNATNVPFKPTFTWATTEEGIEYYELIVAEDEALTQTVIAVDSLTETSFTPEENFLAEKSYYWTVRQSSATEVSEFASPWNFTTKALDPVSVMYPTNNTSFVGLNPVFTWYKTTGAATYEIVVSKNENLSEPVIQQAGIPDTNFTATASLESFTRYYWQIRAADPADTKSAWTPIYTFKTDLIGEFNPGNVDYSFEPFYESGSTISTIAVQPDGMILASGVFTFPTQRGNYIADDMVIRMHPDGSRDTTFVLTLFDDRINDIALQPDGKIVVAGRFDNTLGRDRILRLQLDGTLDESFDAGDATNSEIQVVKLQPDGKILIGGQFSLLNGLDIRAIARLNSDGSRDESFNTGLGPRGIAGLGTVSMMEIQLDGKILIAGQFATYNGISQNSFARINPDGSLDESFTTSLFFISAFEPQNDGKIAMAHSGAGVYMSRVNYNGSTDDSFSSQIGSNLSVITQQNDGKYLIGGIFRSANRVTTNRIARLLNNGSRDETFEIGTGADNTVKKIHLAPDNKIYIVGDFTTVDGRAYKNLARLFNDDTVESTGVPSLYLPADESITELPNEAELIWNQIFNADAYRVQVSSTNSFDALLVDSLVTKSNRILIENLADQSTYFWRVGTVIGEEIQFSMARSFSTPEAVSNEFSQEPVEFALFQNYPNPFNPTTTIRFSLAGSEHVRLEVYNAVGQLVQVLANQPLSTGVHAVTFDARNLASGLYIYRIQAGNFVEIRKMILIK